jgi:hypothetical protein
MAKTITAAANKNRQKQSFMICPPSSSHDIIKYESMASSIRFLSSGLAQIHGDTYAKSA